MDKPSKRKRTRALVAGLTLAESIGLFVRTGRPGGNIVVRCRQGHLFTTLWLPAVSLKALRLGWWRVQRCPVGHHWSLVTPVNESDLSARERRSARRHRDLPIP